MKRNNGMILCAAFCAVAWLGSSVQAGLVHRFSFDTDGSDSVGSATVTPMGTASISGGALNLTGGGDGNSYGDLTDLIASAAAAGGNSGEISAEAWVSINNNGNWRVIWSFGNSGPELDRSGQNGTYWQVIPQNGADSDTRSTTRGDGFEDQATTGVDREAAGPLSTGELHQVLVTIDKPNNLQSLYVDGALVGTGGIAADFDPNTYDVTGAASSPFDVQNWLGRSQWGDDSLDGAITEFRIYDTALSAVAVRASYGAGPDSIVPEPASYILLAGFGLGIVAMRRRLG